MRLRACFLAPWAAGMGSPAGSPYHVGVGGSCIWRASRREAPTASQWTICTFRPALHSSLFTLHLALETGSPWPGFLPPAPVLSGLNKGVIIHNVKSFAFILGSSFFNAFDSICLTRSRVTPSMLPTSSNVFSRPSLKPYLSRITCCSRGFNPSII